MSDNLKLRFKNNLSFFRSKFGLTQSELADYVGVSKNTISSIERFEFCPSAFLAFKLCFAFGCSFEELFYFDFL